MRLMVRITIRTNFSELRFTAKLLSATVVQTVRLAVVLVVLGKEVS